jgi:hypothetical protein
MYINELAETKILVVYCGRFQPFHQGHAWVYNYLTGKFGRNNVYVATSGKVEQPNSPFTFADRVYFMNLQGVPSDRIVQIPQNYNITAVKQAFNIPDLELNRFKVIFPVSKKDMDQDPRFQSWTKKDGSPTALQPMPDDLSQVETMDRHGYVLTVPTKPFKVLGKTIIGATAIRNEYATSDESTRQKIIANVFGRYTHEAEQIFNHRLLPANPITAPELPIGKKAKLQTVKQPKSVDLTDYEYSAESVAEVIDVDAIHEEMLREHLLTNPKLFEDTDDYTRLKEFLSQQATPVTEPGNNYIYTSVQSLLPVQAISIAHFSKPHKLVKIENNRAYFDINGKLKGYPEEGTLTGDMIRSIFMFATPDQLEKFKMMLSLKFGEWSLKSKLIEHSLSETGGVGVVKGGKDPRYMTAIMGDQNDVTGNTLGKEMDAFMLTGRKSPGGKTHQKPVNSNTGRGLKEGAIDELEQRRIDDLNNLMDEIKQRISTENLPATYIDSLKQRLLKLKAERDSYYKINTR